MPSDPSRVGITLIPEIEQDGLWLIVEVTHSFNFDFSMRTRAKIDIGAERSFIPSSVVEGFQRNGMPLSRVAVQGPVNVVLGDGSSTMASWPYRARSVLRNETVGIAAQSDAMWRVNDFCASGSPGLLEIPARHAILGMDLLSRCEVFECRGRAHAARLVVL